MIGGCTNPAKATSDRCSISVIYSYVLGSGYNRVLKSAYIDRGKGYWILLNNVMGEGELKYESLLHIYFPVIRVAGGCCQPQAHKNGA